MKAEPKHPFEITDFPIDCGVGRPLILASDDIGLNPFCRDGRDTHLPKMRLQMFSVLPNPFPSLSFIKLIVLIDQCRKILEPHPINVWSTMQPGRYVALFDFKKSFG